MSRFVKVKYVCAKDVEVGDVVKFHYGGHWEKITAVEDSGPLEPAPYTSLEPASLKLIAGPRSDNQTPLSLMKIQVPAMSRYIDVVYVRYEDVRKDDIIAGKPS